MKHIKSVIRSAVFLSLLVSSLLAINKVLIPKFTLKNSLWPTTSTYLQFYDMEKNSIDVLFIGSSVVVNAFIPQEIYNEYGIRSYNLGSEQQSIYLSYYWLKEALRFQSPKAVVLDLRFMWNYHPENAINTVESLTRKCLDPMKWSYVKREAVHNVCGLDDSQSELSYYLTNIRFHSRWSSIQEYDINYEMIDTSPLKGYSPTTDKGPGSYETYEQNDTSATMEFTPLMQEYLDRIVTLCKENNISLILIDLPGNAMDDAINNTHTAYAERNGIEYYNLCSTEHFNQIGAILPEENVIEHENIWGAIKTSRYIGTILRDQYGIEPVHDDQYETYYPSDSEPWEPNITTLADFKSKWSNMLLPGTPIPTPKSDCKETQYTRVGVFEGAGYMCKGVYRPAQECRMKVNDVPAFCPVCQRAIERMIRYYTE